MPATTGNKSVCLKNEMILLYFNICPCLFHYMILLLFPLEQEKEGGKKEITEIGSSPHQLCSPCGALARHFSLEFSFRNSSPLLGRDLSSTSVCGQRHPPLWLWRCDVSLGEWDEPQPSHFKSQAAAGLPPETTGPTSTVASR